MDEYLKTLLEQIRCKKARPYIRQELQDHIEDQIEANIHAGMNYEDAEKEAVRDMGDPVETGISLDRIHKPQIAWKLLVLVVLLSVAGILTHLMIAGHISGGDAPASGRYVIYVVLGIAVMIFLYFLDYTLLARFSKLIAVILLAMCLLTLYFGCTVNGMRYFIIIGGGSVSIPALMLISMLVMLTIALQKDWFAVQKKKALGGLWGIFTVMPIVIFLIAYWGNAFAPYQKARIQAVVSNRGETSYLTATLRSILTANKFAGNSGVDVTEMLPAYNADYILAYLSSVYGMIAAILICCVLTVLILTVFHTAMKQKNQLGMMMGCGCGMIFLVSFLINVLENVGAFPPAATFMPFLSAGGSYLIVSYGLTGIVLSIYRYKNIYPQHVRIRRNKNRITIHVF